MHWHESLVARATLVIVTGALGMTSARAQSDNFTDPPGRETTPLGELGRVDTSGEGERTLVVIPDPDFDVEAWSAFVDRYDEAFAVHLIVLAGSDGTDPPPMPGADVRETPWIDGATRGIIEHLESEALVSPILVGILDKGGYFATRVALERPDLVGGVVTIGAGPRVLFFGSDIETPMNDARRVKYIEENFIPFARTVASSRWPQGGFTAGQLSIDFNRGRELFDTYRTQGTPASVRYQMELFTTNLLDDLSSIDVPYLAVVPHFGFNDLMQQQAVFDVASGSATNLKDARKAALEAFTEATRSGDGPGRKQLVQAAQHSTREWSRLRGDAKKKIRVEKIRVSRLLVMYDQPAEFDDALNEFIDSLDDTQESEGGDS